MAYWLAEKRRAQHTDVIQRFDPRFWTVDFPRPMMASVVTTAPDALRVDCEFHHANALAGLIWESEDRLDHPLLAYDTQRDYARCTLRFRWRSSNLVALDAVHGPTLTIEGRDAAGTARSWYVRLWNYAVGTPADARITLPFSALADGWEGAGPAVHPAAIDRMFISLAPPQYDPADGGLLPFRVIGWAEMSDISCDGERAQLTVGDAMVPPHPIGMATAYDDSYNQTPERLLRGMLGLGYRGAFIHYVGMSHYPRLLPNAAGVLEGGKASVFAKPAEEWHRDFFTRAAALGFAPIPSLSYELFAEICPPEFAQRASDGSMALTGWEPPSTLLSPANDQAMQFLRLMMTRIVGLLEEAGAPVTVQVGEPWWWVTPEGKLCLYDDAARAAFGGNPPAIDDVTAPMDAGQLDLLDQAGALLALSTQRLRTRVANVASGPAETYLLTFTPTVLADTTPELHRANMPAGWAWPAFDRLQVEDYDWLTAGAEGARRQAYRFVQDKLGYPLDRQDYMAGFVLLPGDADAYWRRIDTGLDEAAARGVPRRFVWAHPQVMRDGYTRLPEPEDDMQAFDDVPYPLALGRETAASPHFATAIALTASGHERRNSQWADARMQYDVGPGIRSEAELGVLLEFFRARRGPARGFRLADPFDFSSRSLTGTPTPTDQLIGIGDGLTAGFDLVKTYGEGPDAQERRITRPRPETVVVSVDAVPTHAFTLGDGGRVVFDQAPPAGARIRAGFLFDVPVRFAEDRLDISGATFAAGEAPSVPLIEIREAV